LVCKKALNETLEQNDYVRIDVNCLDTQYFRRNTQRKPTLNEYQQRNTIAKLTIRGKNIRAFLTH